jgi:hypothetical protein
MLSNWNWDTAWKVGIFLGGIYLGLEHRLDARKARKEREHVADTLEQATTVTAKKLDSIHVLVDGEYTTALLNLLMVLKELYAYTMKSSDWTRVEAAQLTYDRHIAQQKVIHELELKKIEAVSAGKKLRE